MSFADKLKELRRGASLTQAELAKKLGIPLRTYQTYEAGVSYPKNIEIYSRLAAFYNVSTDYLLGSEERYITDAAERGGTRAGRQVAELLSRANGLFAGGELSEEDKELVMKSLYDIYWDAKLKNSKYAKNSVVNASIKADKIDTDSDDNQDRGDVVSNGDKNSNVTIDIKKRK
ncbi:MAG TPA: helix-turn-helix domain-containing protein [Bacillota bacterium]|nr:helix-turn-helix domain-containing protein [Clostridiales bacterium]HOQ14018.1 helix-turn-helix domain-containing protein [Bacillota bacterium]